MTKTIIPIFFAADDKYLPYLTVAITSLKLHADRKNKDYRLYVLHAGMDEVGKNKLEAFNEEDFSVEFVDVSEDLKKLAENLHMRDYYTAATYYRIFIAGLFPQYDKALYLDSDIVLTADVSELFATELGDNLVAAVPDWIVIRNEHLRRYSEFSMGVHPDKYFNAGVLVMNLKQFRAFNFYEKFAKLLTQYAFRVAQDQDYLNVMCRDKVVYLPTTWDAMPHGNHTTPDMPKLIHYNLTAKPWHYEDILYAEMFWKYAKMTEYYDEIRNVLEAYTDEEKERDAVCEKALIDLAETESYREDAYYRVYGENEEVFQRNSK